MEVRVKAERLVTYSFRGNDRVSQHATEELHNLALNAESGSLFRALDAYILAIDDQVAKLTDTLSEYDRLEELNSITATSFELPEKPTPGPTGDNYAV